MESNPEFLNEEEAAQLWQRAAQLQAEAARRAEKAESDRAETEASGETADVAPPEGYALTHVRSAALEVGIANEFVDAALADLRAGRALSQEKRGWRLARWFLKDPPEAQTARRVIEAAAVDVLSATEAVFPGEPYRLTLTDRQGDPLKGGFLVFDVQGLNSPFPRDFALEAKYGGIRQVFLSLQPIEEATPSCEVTLRSPVAWSHNQDLAVGGVVTGITGAVGLGLGLAGAVAVAAIGLSGIGVVVAPAILVAGGATGGGLGVKGYRARYRHAMRRGQRALDGLLGAVAGRAEGGWGITKSQDQEPPPALP
ncbi:MAG TPA: hypothetical protein DCE19_08080 [Gemmatimonadetes bacterium]|nr:hypothetical protein [Gemmatimonadota bacterium]